VRPVWSPDGAKVATAFDYDIAVYDAGSSAPTAGGLPLAEPLRAASVEYDERVFKRGGPQANGAGAAHDKGAAGGASNAAGGAAQAAAGQAAGEAVLISLNPVVRLEWEEPETLYAQTAFVRFYRNEALPTFKYTRWHVVHVSAQAALLSLRGKIRNVKSEENPPRKRPPYSNA
jgi:hypothetical protein